MNWEFSATPHSPKRRYEEPYDALLNAPTDAWCLMWDEGKVRGLSVIAPTLGRFAWECSDMADKTPDLENAHWCHNWRVMANNGDPIVGARGAARHAMICLGEEQTIRQLLKDLCEEVAK